MSKKIPDRSAKVKKARRLYADGVTLAAIGRRLKVSIQTAGRWCGLSTYQHASVKKVGGPAGKVAQLARRARRGLPLFDST